MQDKFKTKLDNLEIHLPRTTGKGTETSSLTRVGEHPPRKSEEPHHVHVEPNDILCFVGTFLFINTN